jgi:hypothetical protein
MLLSPVYLWLTKFILIERFERIVRVEASITYLESIGCFCPIPPPGTKITKDHQQNGLSSARGHFAWWLIWWLFAF